MTPEDDLEATIRAHCIDVRRSWPGERACACRWKGENHAAHIAEKLREEGLAR